MAATASFWVVASMYADVGASSQRALRMSDLPETHDPDAPLVPQSQRCQCSCRCLMHGQPVADDPVRANGSSDPTWLTRSFRFVGPT
jgi:hypothetical protein